MSVFEERERAFENKFVHDADLAFRAQARSNKMLGLWAAELLGKQGEIAQAYADAMVVEDIQTSNQEAVVSRVRNDLRGKATSGQIMSKIAELRLIAHEQLMSGHSLPS